MPFIAPVVAFLGTTAGAVTASAVIGAGTALYSAGQAKDAAGKALTAQQQAQQQQLAAQQTALDRITNLQNPYVQGGYNALGQLASQYGLGVAPGSGPVTNAYGAPPPQAGAGTPAASGGLQRPTIPGPATGGPPGAPAAAPGAGGGQPDWNGYIAQHPDVQQWIAEGHGDPSLGANQTPQQAAQYQYENSIRLGTPFPAPPMLPANPQGPQPDPATQTPQDLGTASPVVPTYATPDFGQSPDAASYLDASKFEASPDYAWRLAQGQRNLNANFGAKGLLQSGSAIQGALDYGQHQASQEFQNWWNRQQQLYSDKASQYNTDKTTNYNIFSTDRGYGTDLALNNRNFANSQQNTRIANLFSLVNAGTGAAASVGGANSNYANNASNVYGSQAQAAADAANANASANSQLGGTLGGIGSRLINGYSTSNGALPSPATIPDYTGVTSTNPNFYGGSF